MRQSILLVSFLAVLASTSGRPLLAQVDLEQMAQRAGVRHAEVPRKVLAFYYPWYVHRQADDGSGRASSWTGADPVKRQIGNVAHYPLLGPYDSQDPKLINQHCTWAKQAGVDGLIVSWWGKDSPTDRAMERILDACKDGGLEATIYYETVPKPQDAESAAKDIADVLTRYAKHPAWLCVNKKPVVFVYGRTLGEIGLPGWLSAVSQIDREYKGGAILVGDDLSRASARIFDGIHTYNPVGAMQGKTVDQVRAWAKAAYPAWVANADAFGRISTITVLPGYDDTKIRKPGLRVERTDGALYEAQWEEALAANPHWILITSWNEWYEGSEIEPCAEFGKQYLRLTAEYTARFKRLGKRADAWKTSQGQSAGRPAIRHPEKLKDFTCRVLPDPQSAAIWSLAALPVKPAVMTWQQVADLQPADAKKSPVLIYAAEERYRQTAKRPGDVDQGLLRYLSAGGLLMVLPAGPMPFHYNEQRAAVNTSSKLGLPLSVAGENGGWEQPPAGVKLRFVQVGHRLPSVPASFPFPQDGDPRWRPFVRSQSAQGDVFVPLVELRDETGKHYGDAVAYVEHKASEPKNGKILYVWFGLLNSPYGEGLLSDLLEFVAERTGAK